MKAKLCTVLALLLCLSLFLIPAPGAFADGEGEYAVHFYSEKNYDLAGLTLYDADGSEIAPAGTEGGYTYLLTPGIYRYAYHDSLGIFPDLGERFAVSGGTLEIPLDLRPVFANTVEAQFDVNPYYADQFDESDLDYHAQALQAELDRVVDVLAQERSASSAGFLFGDTSVFYFAEDDVQAGIEVLRDALVHRQPSASVTIYTGTTPWNADDYNNTLTTILTGAFRHTGNQCEGDTLLWERGSIGRGGGSYNNYDQDRKSYYHILPYTMEYISTAAQEAQTANKVDSLVSELGLNGMSDYDKLRTIEEYLYTHVNYDRTLARHSSYHTLIENNSVCQGFATSFYRLCLAAGLEARVVSSKNMGHGWNIAKIGGRYYYVDATWDSNTREYGYSMPLPYYFLRGSDWWLQNHKLDGVSELGDEFTDTANIFYDPAFAAYNVSSVDFDPASLGLAVDAVNFPDDAFRAYVSANFDTSPDGYLSDEEIAAVTAIDCSGTETAPGSIASLKGVEHFTALETLNCFNNKLTSIDLSANSRLWALNCADNRIQQVDLGSNPLKFLFCARNQIASLDVKNHASLSYLDCSSNPVSALDLTGCSELSSLKCNNCGLRSLNVRVCPKISMVECMSNALTSLDVSGCDTLLSLSCQDNALTALNLTGCTALENLECGGNSLTNLNLSSCGGSLHHLICFDNSLTELDITPCPVLVYTRFAAEPVVSEGVVSHFDSFGNAISCDEAVRILISGLLELPADVTEIEEEAFKGGAFIYVKLAEGTVSVGPRAFADCPNLSFLYIPAQTAVDATAFEGSNNAYIYRAGTDAAVPAISWAA